MRIEDTSWGSSACVHLWRRVVVKRVYRPRWRRRWSRCKNRVFESSSHGDTGFELRIYFQFKHLHKQYCTSAVSVRALSLSLPLSVGPTRKNLLLARSRDGAETAPTILPLACTIIRLYILYSIQRHKIFKSPKRNINTRWQLLF